MSDDQKSQFEQDNLAKLKKDRQFFDDLASEVDAGILEDTFEVWNHKYKMKILSSEEVNWRNAHIIMATKLSALTSFQLPTLAMAIKEIDGEKIVDKLESEWLLLSKDDMDNYLSMGPYARKYFTAEKLMEWLAGRDEDFISALYTKYDELNERRKKVQAELKKSFRETSEKEEKKNSTEVSQDGEQLQQSL